MKFYNHSHNLDRIEETDWKIIAINVNDRCCEHINDIRSVNYYKPGCLKAIKDWFEHYKTARGKEKNKFGFNKNNPIDRA